MDKGLILKEIKKHLDIKKDGDFAAFLGIKQNTLSTWKSRNSIDYDLIIAKCEDINPAWLLTGKGEMLISKTPQIVDEIEGPIPTTIDKKAINERFEKAVELLLSEKLAVSKADIAQGLGIKPSAFTEILSGRNQVSADKILMLCERFPVNSEFIFYGKGAILRSGINEIDFAEMAVPFFESEVIGGVGNHTFSMDKKDISTYYVVPDFKIRGCDMIIGLTGDSMSPKYNNGDKIACKILHEKKVVEYGKVFVVGTREHGLILKRVRKSTNPNNYLMVSDNPDYDAFEVEKEDVTGLALVLGILRID